MTKIKTLDFFQSFSRGNNSNSASTK